MFIYLAGPHVEDHAGSQGLIPEWRALFQAELLRQRVRATCFDPWSAFGRTPDSLIPEASRIAVIAVNRAAIKACNVLVANLSRRISLGTVREIEYARSLSKTVMILSGDRYPEISGSISSLDLRVYINAEDAVLAIQSLYRVKPAVRPF